MGNGNGKEIGKGEVPEKNMEFPFFSGSSPGEGGTRNQELEISMVP